MSTEQTAEDPRIDRAIDVILRMQRIENPAAIKAFMPQLDKDARLLLAAIDGPEPDWADVREAARKAGYRLSHTAKRRRNDRRMWLWYALDGDDPVGEFHKTSTGVQVHLRGPKGYTALLEFSAAAVLTAARLVGLGGDSDER